MKSLQKALDILELVLLNNGIPVTPSEVAKSLNLNAVTCLRIMKKLTARDYLEQVSRRDGYRPGPMIPALARRMNSYTLAAAAARKPLRELAKATGMPVNLALLGNSGRIMIAYSGGSPRFLPWKKFRFELEPKNAATGKLLFAAMNKAERKKLTATCPELQNFQQEDLDRCVTDKKTEYPNHDGLILMGRLLLEPGFPPLAFGFGVAPDKDLPKIREMADAAARSIQNILLAVGKN